MLWEQNYLNQGLARYNEPSAHMISEPYNIYVHIYVYLTDSILEKIKHI